MNQHTTAGAARARNVARALPLMLALSLWSWAARAQELGARPAATPAKVSASAGIITGRVLGEDGRPIQGATVSFNRAFASSGGPPRGVSTDAEGKFIISNLVPGLYIVNGSSPGFVIAPDPANESGEGRYYRPGDFVNVTLIKGGVITGTVRDSNGEPLVSALVRVMRVRDAQGRALPRAFGGPARMSDDRGVYRIYGLTAGTYVVSAGGSMGFNLSANAYEGDSPTFYPSSTRDTAAELPLRAGEELSGIDIRYRGEPGRSVSGTIAGADSSNRFGINVTLRQPSGGFESNTFVMPNDKLSFSFQGVADGTYELVAQQFSNSAMGGEPLASPPRRVTVKGSDVTGVELTLAPMGSISGRVTVEPAPKEGCAEAGGAPLNEAVVSARRDDRAQGPQPGATFFGNGANIPNDQGEFTIRNLGPGGYRIGVRLPSESWYVRSIVLPAPAAATAPAKPGEAKAAPSASVLTLKAGEKMTGVAVQIAQDAAGIKGRVTGVAEGAQLPANLKVYLVPSERERAEDLLRYAETVVLPDGTFVFKNLAPGRYFMLARVPTESELSELPVRPLAWDSATRAKLRREAEAANNAVELKPCQRVTDHALPLPAPK